MIPTSNIGNPEVTEFAERAANFLCSHSWCGSIESANLAWAVAGVLGVFQFKIIPARPGVDETLWVIVGDIPSAYVVCDNAPTWREALEGYISEMRLWVGAVRNGSSLEDIIPVAASPTLEHADMLAGRLDFIAREILAHDAAEIESDS